MLVSHFGSSFFLEETTQFRSRISLFCTLTIRSSTTYFMFFMMFVKVKGFWFVDSECAFLYNICAAPCKKKELCNDLVWNIVMKCYEIISLSKRNHSRFLWFPILTNNWTLSHNFHLKPDVINIFVICYYYIDVQHIQKFRSKVLFKLCWSSILLISCIINWIVIFILSWNVLHVHLRFLSL